MTETLRDELRHRQLLPHQVEFIETAIGSLPRGRVLLADPVGLGKTRACADLVWSWTHETGNPPRTLVLAPQSLLSQWQAELAQFAAVDPQVVDAAGLRRLEAHTQTNENPWATVETALTTVDFVKRGDRLKGLLGARWDLVILDEAHLGVAGQRGQVLRALWESDRVDLMVCVSATPYTGRSEDVELFAAPETRIVRRRAQDLLDWEGRPLLGDAIEQAIEVLQVELSSEERELYHAALAVLRSANDNPQTQFLIGMLIRAAASSIFAFEGSLRRALFRASHRDFIPAEAIEVETPEDDFGDSSDTEDQVTSYPLTRDQLHRLVQLVDRIEVDSKWNACSEILRAHVTGGGGPVVIFSDFRDTGGYLAGLIGEMGMDVTLLTGASTAADRERATDDFRREGGVLVLTSAASEGLGLSAAKLCIHYDVPWNPNLLAQRFGRIHRFGAPPGPVRHVAFADGLFTSDALVNRVFSFEIAASNEGPATILSAILSGQVQ